MEQGTYKRIVINPAVMVGKPVIRGTRIPVDLIVRLLAQGMTPQDILEDYPNLRLEDIQEALHYVSDVVRGENVYLFTEKKEHAKEL